MKELKYPVLLFFLLAFALAVSGGPIDDQWNVREVRIDTSNAYRRVALPGDVFDGQKVKTVDKYFISKSVRGQFNGVVLFAQDDKVFIKSYGYADFCTKQKLSASSKFQLASISKTITATAVLMLAQDSLIDIEAPVDDYLEGFGREKVTVKMLLTHTSGLPDYTRFTLGSWASSDPMSNREMLAIMLKKKPKALFRPGAQYKYCNTNYALLACIVEEVTGQGFAQWVRENIFEPVGMSHTLFCTEESFARADNLTTGHSSRRAPYRMNFLDGVLGDKGVYSTVEDLLSFDLALREGFLLSEQWQQMAYTNYTDEVHPYGLGWRLSEYGGHRIAYHNGWWHGYKGRFLRIPEEKMTIIVLENQDRSSFSVPTLINISRKLFDKKPDEAEIVETGEEETEEG